MENGHAVDVPDYDRFVGAVCRGRKPYALREMAYRYFNYPRREEIIFLAGGMPNPASFPFKSANFVLNDGSKIEIEVG